MKIEVDDKIYQRICHFKESLELLQECGGLTERQKGILDGFRIHFPIFGTYKEKKEK